MTRFVVVIGALAALVVGVAAAQGSAQGSTQRSADEHGRPLGIVPPHGSVAAAAARGNRSNLVNHGGPVLHSNTAYAIYWVPAGYSVSAKYQTLIDGFFTNVAADDGKTTNTYYSTTQYYDGTGYVGYGVAFGGSTLDTSGFPTSGCSDTVAATSVCLSDAQLQAEIDRVRQAKGWPSGLGSIYFLFTPRGVGSCYGSSCAFSTFCAYHSSFASGGQTVLYANQPYTATVASACDAGQHPNGDDADPTINVVSHEHQESMTDPLGSAWYDRSGYENADKCAWSFGAVLGSTSTGQYNQVIGAGKYYLQQDWSNQRSGCVLTGT